jgi:hypothetical protein
MLIKNRQQPFFKKNQPGLNVVDLGYLLADRFIHINPGGPHRAFKHPGVKQGHIVIIQNSGVEITLPESETMLESVAEPIGECVHLGVGKVTVSFDVNHSGAGGKLQSSLLKYSAHIYEHVKLSCLEHIELPC